MLKALPFRITFVVAAFCVYSTEIFAGDGYECGFQPYGSNIELHYVVYDATERASASSSAYTAYRRIVSDHSDFFGLHHPSITFVDRSMDATKFAFGHSSSDLGHIVVVIGDEEAAFELKNKGLSPVVFVPSDQMLGNDVIKEIEAATLEPYYLIAVDHALRRGTRMLGEGPSGLSEITPEHIFANVVPGGPAQR